MTVFLLGVRMESTSFSRTFGEELSVLGDRYRTLTGFGGVWGRGAQRPSKSSSKFYGKYWVLLLLWEKLI